MRSAVDDTESFRHSPWEGTQLTTIIIIIYQSLKISSVVLSGDFEQFEDVQKQIRIFSTVPELQYAHLEPIVPISYFPAKPVLGKKKRCKSGA